jgi:hypothetical protein
MLMGRNAESIPMEISWLEVRWAFVPKAHHIALEETVFLVEMCE